MKTKRQNEILKLLMLKRDLKTEQLVQQFGVSIETIRRDISELEREGLIKKVYGGVRMVTDDLRVTELQSWSQRLEHCHKEKIQIVAHTLPLIPDGSTIALDIGTTVYELSRLLGKKKNLTILTNSLKIAGELSQSTNHTIYSIGGTLMKGEMVTTGTFARSFLDNFASIDLFLCSADGITPESGITEFSEGVIDIKRQLCALADQTIALVDHSKFGKRALFRSCATQDIDVLVTDGQAPRKMAETIEKLGVEVLFAQETEIFTN